MMSMGGVGGGADYYGKDNYYSAQEAADKSSWTGKGADQLGLKGAVEPQALTEMLSGNLPNGVQIRSFTGEHRDGNDLTFSIPKSASLLALLGADKRIEKAMVESVKATLDWAEKHLIEARVTDKATGAQVTEKSGNLVAALYTHDLSRNGDPQLHVHAVLMNATLASDGKWHAIKNDELYKNQHLLGAIQNADFRQRVEGLGFQTTPAQNPRDGAFEISGVNRDVVTAYSTRREEIKEQLEATGRSSAREREIVTLATRKAKDPDITPEARMAQWKETAERLGFDPKPIIDAALRREASQETLLSKIVEGVQGVGAQGIAIAASMGLTPKDGDELVPERLGKLAPVEFAAAQAVASGARELGENEAAWSRNDLILRSLERHGPFGVEQVEARIDQLIERGLLVAGNELMTRHSEIELEQRVIANTAKGNDAVSPIASGIEVGPRLQQAARDLGLRRLNAGQEKAGVDILTTSNRVMLLQGSAGTGKSATLAPVAEIARGQGHQVHALAHVGRIAKEFGGKVGAPGMTVDGFLGKYGPVLDGSAKSNQVVEAYAKLTGSVILVDEAGQIGTQRLGRLVELANQMGVARLVLAGDTKQLTAIEAGKPFEQLQDHGQQKALINENLRAQTPQMIALNQALEVEDTEKAFEILEPDTHQVDRGSTPEAAAKIWGSLSPEDRSETLLLASGRAMRTDANDAVQAERKEKGELGRLGLMLIVLDRVNIGKEGARQLKGYREGRIVEFQTNLPSQGMERGDRGKVLGFRGGKVELLMSDGELRLFSPDKLSHNLKNDAVVIYEQKPITVHAGDQIRWTEKDAERGLLRNEIAEVTFVSGGLTARGTDGREHVLEAGDKMLEKLDLAYAINVHISQGMTAKAGIMLMDSSERLLNTFRTFLVASTRIAEHVSLVIDNAEKLERDIGSNAGDKTSALEQAQPDSGNGLKSPANDRIANDNAANPHDFGTTQDQPDISNEIEPSRDFGMEM